MGISYLFLVFSFGISGRELFFRTKLQIYDFALSLFTFISDLDVYF